MKKLNVMMATLLLCGAILCGCSKDEVTEITEITQIVGGTEHYRYQCFLLNGEPTGVATFAHPEPIAGKRLLVYAKGIDNVTAMLPCDAQHANGGRLFLEASYTNTHISLIARSYIGADYGCYDFYLVYLPVK